MGISSSLLQLHHVFLLRLITVCLVHGKHGIYWSLHPPASGLLVKRFSSSPNILAKVIPIHKNESLPYFAQAMRLSFICPHKTHLLSQPASRNSKHSAQKEVELWGYMFVEATVILGNSNIKILIFRWKLTWMLLMH